MNRKQLLWILVAIAFVVGLAIPASAGIPVESARAPIVEAPSGAGDDGGAWEVGVEEVLDYGGSDNLPASDNTAQRLYDTLGAAGWTKSFNYKNQWAWEEDYKRAAMGGWESYYVDRVDFAFYHGHGSVGWDQTFGRYLNGPYFGVGGRDHDDSMLVPGDAYRSWGDGDGEWVGMKGCQILSDASRGYWASAMYGLHLIAGFVTNSYSTPGGDFGWWLGYYIRRGYSFKDAWFYATDRTQPSGTIARVMAQELCQFADRWGSVCGDTYDWVYYWVDHVATSTSALSVDPADLNYQMPVLSVVAAAPTSDQLAHLTTAFGFAPNTPAPLDDATQLYHAEDAGLDLIVDKQGMFAFNNRERMWVVPTSTVALAASQSLTPPDAEQIATDFLTANHLLPADAEFSGVVNDTFGSAQITPSLSVANSIQSPETVTMVDTVLDTATTVQQAVFSRQIEYTSTHGTPLAFSVEGPGATLKVYVDNSGEIVGAMGGWRALDEVSVLDTVQILTPTQMLQLYRALGDGLNLASTLFEADVVTVTRSTVGYYEQALGSAQTTLTPVYVLDIDMGETSSGGSLTSTAYIPAAANLLPPLAKITSVTDPEPIVALGAVITLTAADASQPLSALGYGDNLNFVLGQGPYTYTWKLTTQDIVIGAGRTITYPVGLTDFLGSGKGTDAPIVVRLEVTDAAGRTSQVTQPFYFAGVMDLPTVFLPVTIK